MALSLSDLLKRMLEMSGSDLHILSLIHISFWLQSSRKLSNSEQTANKSALYGGEQ